MKKIIPVCLFLCLCLVGFAFAQEESKAINETNLFNVYQIANDSLNRLIYILTFIASALMLFFLIGTTIFLYRQYEENKKIKRRAIAFKKSLELSLNNIKTKEREIEKIHKAVTSKKSNKGKEVKENKALLERMERELEYLRGEINFQNGKISIASTASTPISLSGLTDRVSVSASGDSMALGSISSMLGNCQNCSCRTSVGDRFCPQCGNPL